MAALAASGLACALLRAAMTRMRGRLRGLARFPLRCYARAYVDVYARVPWKLLRDVKAARPQPRPSAKR
eukprot:12992256-Alexandrium_andersonii.AAC.1